MQSEPIARELVLAGGGHSHVILLRKLGMNPIPGLQITMLSPDTRTPYSGMLPGLVAGHYSEDDIHIDLVPLCRFAGARFIRGRIDGINPIERTIHTIHSAKGQRPDLRYDVLSVDIGITPSMDNVPGAPENVIPVKPIGGFLNRWYTFLHRMGQGDSAGIGFVGSGAGGVELCLSVYHRLQQAFPAQSRRLQWHLFSDSDDILPEYPKSVRNRFRRAMAERQITIHHNFRVDSVRERTLISTSGEHHELDEIFWVTSAASQDWLPNTGLSLDERGFIWTLNTLQTEHHPDIFAVGDIAHQIGNTRPKAGVFAVRQGPVLEDNIRRLLTGKPLRQYQPQADFLSLISTGDQYAVASRNHLSIGGRWVWRWKDRIDQRFMDRFRELPDMAVQPGTGLLADFDTRMQCGGCGSKVSADLLAGVLDEIGTRQRDDAAIYQVPSGMTMLHSVDYFKSFIDDPWDFAQVAVTHALSDIYAMGGQPVTALAMVTVPYGKPPVIRSLLQQLLTASKQQLDADKVALIGGHTTEGTELTVGFAVNGIVDESRVLRKSGMRPGQMLILTKALGTGTLFAADMQYKARGSWVEEAIRSMKRSNLAALTILRDHQVAACTDITGFGLAGHLLEMISASHCGVRLDPDKLPILDGSHYTLNTLDIKSTLHAANRGSALAFSNRMITELSDHPNLEMLFDPQTSGGLLASVPAEQSEVCVRALIAAGYRDAACIGEVTDESS